MRIILEKRLLYLYQNDLKTIRLYLFIIQIIILFIFQIVILFIFQIVILFIFQKEERQGNDKERTRKGQGKDKERTRKEQGKDKERTKDLV